MVAPEVASVMEMVCADVNVPVAGVTTGVAAAGNAEMVYTALATLLGEKPEAVAIAWMVCEEPTLRAEEYCFVVPLTLVAGVDPSVV